MAIITASDWAAWSQTTLTAGAMTTAATTLASQIDAAIKKAVFPNLLESASLTLVLDAPADPVLVLPHRPVQASGLAIYFKADSTGDPTLFTSDHLLTNYEDYRLEGLDPTGTYSPSGRVRRRAQAWGSGWERPPDWLAARLAPGRAQVKVTGTFGYSSVPDDVKLAAYLAFSLVWNRRKLGAAKTSEGWQGYSYGLPGEVTAAAAVRSPDVADLLSHYMPARFA